MIRYGDGYFVKRTGTDVQTYSHLIITAALDVANKDKIESSQGVKVDTWALLLGSFMPDMPLVILTLIFFVQNGVFGGGAQDMSEIFGPAYDNLYFNDPVWITGHALFHAPPMILLYLTIGYWFGFRGGKPWARALFWFAVGCGLHSAIDIVTHHNDGPLLLFPFNWSWRFTSPVSYWDPDHYGLIFAPLEHLLDLGLLGWLLWRRLRNRKNKVSENEG